MTLPNDNDPPTPKPLFEDSGNLIPIEVEGTTYQVPEDLELLRCFQYLQFEIAYEHFCWNASCENCAAQVAPANGAFSRTLCCQKICEPGLRVQKLPDGVKKK